MCYSLDRTGICCHLAGIQKESIQLLVFDVLDQPIISKKWNMYEEVQCFIWALTHQLTYEPRQANLRLRAFRHDKF